MNELKDLRGRKIDYLRISITDRCNLRCQYCMPEEGVEPKTHRDILPYEDIVKIVRTGVQLGIKKIRITGGEPLVRVDTVELVHQLSEVYGITDLGMTTNGVLLAKYGLLLKDAGLSRVNISLDSLQREKFATVTRRDQFADVMKGIHTALQVGLQPVKINTVLMRGVNDDEIMDFVQLAKEYPLHVRFIEFMPLGAEVSDVKDPRFISADEARERILGKVELTPVELKSSGPAESFRVEGGEGTVGFISPISHNFCGECNRLRLTADGKLRPCLDSNLEINLCNNSGKLDEDHLETNLRKAIMLKPGQHHFYQEREEVSERNMFEIGG